MRYNVEPGTPPYNRRSGRGVCWPPEARKG